MSSVMWHYWRQDNYDSADVYRITKELLGGHRSFNGPVEDVTRRILVEDDGKSTILSRITSDKVLSFPDGMAGYHTNYSYK